MYGDLGQRSSCAVRLSSSPTDRRPPPLPSKTLPHRWRKLLLRIARHECRLFTEFTAWAPVSSPSHGGLRRGGETRATATTATTATRTPTPTPTTTMMTAQQQQLLLPPPRGRRPSKLLKRPLQKLPRRPPPPPRLLLLLRPLLLLLVRRCFARFRFGFQVCGSSSASASRAAASRSSARASKSSAAASASSAAAAQAASAADAAATPTATSTTLPTCTMVSPRSSRSRPTPKFKPLLAGAWCSWTFPPAGQPHSIFPLALEHRSYFGRKGSKGYTSLSSTGKQKASRPVLNVD